MLESLITTFINTKKCSFRDFGRKISSKFHQGALTIIIFLVIFADIARKLENVGPAVSSFNPCLSLPSVSIGHRKHFQCLNIVLTNKTGPLFLELNLCEDTFQLVKETEKKWRSPFKML